MSDRDALEDKLAGLRAQLASAPARTGEELDEIKAATAELARLVELLVARKIINARDAQLMEKVGESAVRPRVHLAMSRDKHTVPSPDIDCASLLHLCHARCCSFRANLSPQDIEENKLRWDLENPYQLARAGDGYCIHLQDGGGCEHYDDRPGTCREYDCREDRRVWLDWENKVPAPMPDGVKPRY
jgi:Fe-S-cluster containining protein